ncbi:fimbrial protein [Scandinavium sp. NPDC088450]|uniref:fimbrial protein n=1 Tax=Scandinavium sp. NPDC088450 TaxID=3364514 RepID=UPI0038506986
MKNKILAVAVTAILAGASINIAQAAGTETTVSGGIVNFTGSVVDAACAVNADSINQTVQMGQVRLKRMDAEGATSGTKVPFNIILQDCETSVSSQVAVTFKGTTDATVTTALANTAGQGAAQQVALQLYDQAGTELTPGVEQSTPFSLHDGINNLTFSVDYVATGSAATAGIVSGTTTFDLHYQ